MISSVKRFATACVFDRHLNDLIGFGRASGGSDQTLILELLHLVDESHSFLTDTVRDRDTDVVEGKFASIAGVVTHLL